MRQFDVFDNPFKGSRNSEPFVVVLQSDMVSDLATVVIAPLAIGKRSKQITRLTPEIDFGGQKLLLHIWDMAAYPARQLLKPRGNISQYRDRIIAAIDLVFTGV